MGLFNSIVSAVSNPTNLLALATMNPAIIAATVGRQLVSQIGQAVIQRLGNELGLPQSVIDMAQAGFAQSMGDVQGAQQNYREALQGIEDTMNSLFDATNASPRDRGELQRVVDQMLEAVTEEGREGADDAERRGGRAGAESFFVAFAKALGRTMDTKMEDMMKIAKDIDKETQKANKSDGEYQAVVGELSAELQGLSQELKLVSDALSTSVKSMGDAVTKTASRN